MIEIVRLRRRAGSYAYVKTLGAAKAVTRLCRSDLLPGERFLLICDLATDREEKAEQEEDAFKDEPI